MRKIFLKISGIVASLALMVTSMNVNTTCLFLVHQPELPRRAKGLRKF